MRSRAPRRWWTAHRTTVRRGGVVALVGLALLLLAVGGVVTMPRARAVLAQLRGPVADRPLVGTEWYLIGGVPGAARVPNTQLTVVFAADGQVSGTAGCNNFQAQYAGDAAHLTIRLGDQTRASCTQMGVMAQERRYLDTLAHVTAGEITGTTLTLDTPQGAMHFTAARPWVPWEWN